MILKLGLILLAAAVVGGAARAQELTWREMADLPRPVAGYMGGVIGGKMLIAGGSYWEDKQKHWSDEVQVFDPASNTWTRGPAMPAPRSDAASAVLGDDLYCFGGGAGNEVTADAWALHDGKWHQVIEAKLPEPRLFAVALAYAGYIYLLGGVPKAGDYKTMPTTFWRWRPGAKGWETLAPLPGAGRISHAMAQIKGGLYVFGGATTGGRDVENLKDAYRYDPKNNKWTELPDLPIADRAWWAVSVRRRALLLGGYTNDFEKQVYWYDPPHNLQSAGSLPHALADTKFYRIGNLVVGAGGEAGAGIRGKWTLAAELPRHSGRSK